MTSSSGPAEHNGHSEAYGSMGMQLLMTRFSPPEVVTLDGSRSGKIDGCSPGLSLDVVFVFDLGAVRMQSTSWSFTLNEQTAGLPADELLCIKKEPAGILLLLALREWSSVSDAPSFASTFDREANLDVTIPH